MLLQRRHTDKVPGTLNNVHHHWLTGKYKSKWDVSSYSSYSSSYSSYSYHHIQKVRGKIQVGYSGKMLI